MSAPAILVLGATGKIGGALIEELLPDHAAGRLRLVAAARRAEAVRQLEERGVEARHIDLGVAETQGLEPILDAMDGIDRLFLLTGYDVKMLAQSKAAIDAAKAAGVGHIVHLGVHARDDTTIAHFGWHQLVEAYIERSRLGYTHLHPASFMQNLPMLARLGGATLGVITHFIGEARTSWVDTGDIAAVAAVVLRAPHAHVGRTYPLATEAASMDEIAFLLTEVTGPPRRYEPQEPEAFLRIMTAAGTDPVYMACVRNVFERTRSGSLAEAAETFDTVERLTGRAATSLRAFLGRHRGDSAYASSDHP
jgi:NAD(P)H dehydrogenase (quinone)